MLTVEDLMIQNTLPGIEEISLQMYKEFAESILMKRKFCYKLANGNTEIIQFKDWSFYHIWAIHHIDYRIQKDKLFSNIALGITSIDGFKADNKIKKRFLDFKDRLQMFSCVYNVLRTGDFFHINTGQLDGTKVKIDVLVFGDADGKGINLGSVLDDDVYVPITILPTRATQQDKYIKNLEAERILEIIICDEADNEIEHIFKE